MVHPQVVAFLVGCFIIPISLVSCDMPSSLHADLTPQDADLILFALNLEYLEADFYLWAAAGFGLDKFAPELTYGGPPPIGVQKANNLDPLVENIIFQFGLEEVGHVRAIHATVPSFPRPQLDLSVPVWARFFDQAFGVPLNPPFDPYANSLNLLISVYVIPYVGLTGYVGSIPMLTTGVAKRLIAGLEGVEGGQDAVIRTLLFQRKEEIVVPYNVSVAEFTKKISNLRNGLGHTGNVDEGLIVPPVLGPEGILPTNILSADANSISFSRTPQQILGILYGNGNPSSPGGFYPNGLNGDIAQSCLHRP